MVIYTSITKEGSDSNSEESVLRILVYSVVRDFVRVGEL